MPPGPSIKHATIHTCLSSVWVKVIMSGRSYTVLVVFHVSWPVPNSCWGREWEPLELGSPATTTALKMTVWWSWMMGHSALLYRERGSVRTCSCRIPRPFYEVEWCGEVGLRITMLVHSLASLGVYCLYVGTCVGIVPRVSWCFRLQAVSTPYVPGGVCLWRRCMGAECLQREEIPAHTHCW